MANNYHLVRRQRKPKNRSRIEVEPLPGTPKEMVPKDLTKLPKKKKAPKPEEEPKVTVGRKPYPFVGDFDYVPEPGVIPSPLIGQKSPMVIPDTEVKKIIKPRQQKI